ncbi:MAG: hypothetical protein R6X08_12420 [Desulfosalsimonadaceae bacterium]
MVAAGNRETDRAVTHRMPSVLANRFAHLNFDADTGEWLDWAQENAVAPEVIAFLRFRPNLLYTFDPQRDDKAFPTPRSREFVSRIMNSRQGHLPDMELLAGVVGLAFAFCKSKIVQNWPFLKTAPNDSSHLHFLKVGKYVGTCLFK